MVQVDSLEIDLPRSLKAHQAFRAGWEAAADREAAYLKSTGARLVVADIPPLAFAAAARAGVPAVGVANFSWDWILDRYGAADPAWRPMARLYAGAYAEAEELFRLPLHCEFPAFRSVRDAPFLVSRSLLTREQARRRLGLSPAERRPLVLVSFGGFGLKEGPLSAGEDLGNFLFAGFVPKPGGLAADWTHLPSRAPRHADLVAAADVVLGKPGYGTIAECVAHSSRLLYVPRTDFPEIPALLAEARRWARTRLLPREDFAAGRWRAGLEALLAAPPPPERARTDGAEVLARELSQKIA